METSNEQVAAGVQSAQVVVIVNAKARLVDDDRLSEEKVQAAFTAHGVQARIQPTSSVEDCYEQVARAAREGAQVVVAAGGDGTIHTVITGLMRVGKPRPALGILASGTMNNIAAAFGIPEDVDAGLALIAECVEQRRFYPMDIGMVGDEPFVEVASVGTLARLTPLGEQLKSNAWEARNEVAEGVRELITAKPQRVTLWLDDRPPLTMPALEVTICNTPSHGARIVLSPSTRIDDGLLDVVVDSRVSGPRMLWDMLVGADHRKMTRDRRRIFQARRVRIGQATRWTLEMDGETKGEYGLATSRRTVEASVEPSAIMVCAPERPTSDAKAVTESTIQTLARLLPAPPPPPATPTDAAKEIASGVSQSAQQVAESVTQTVEQHLTSPQRAAIRLRKMRWVYAPGLAVGVVAALAARRWATLPGDLRIQRAIQSTHSPRMDRFMTAVAAPGFPPLSAELVGAGVVGLWLTRLRLEAAFLLAAAGGVTLFDVTLKRLIRRKRPVDGPARVLKVIDQPSFPSGHVMNYVSVFGFLAAATIANVKPAWLRYLLTSICGGMVALIGPARVYLGAHWPSDTAAGYLFGGLYLGGLLEAYTRAKEKQAERHAKQHALDSASRNGL